MKDKKKNSSLSYIIDFTHVDFALLIVVLMLIAIGLVMVLSASAPQSISEVGNSYYYFIRQIKFAGVGILIMWGLSFVDYKIYEKLYVPIYIVSVTILLLTLVSSIGINVKGATRWVSILGIRFQPSEVAKIGLILSAAAYIKRNKEEMATPKGMFWTAGLVALPLLFLYVFQSHLSACIVIVVILLTMLLTSGVKLKNYVMAGGLGMIPATGLIVAKILNGAANGGYRIQRILTFFDPWKDKQDSGWQIIQGLYALGSGGLFGVGLGQSKQKYLYIPEPHNDFIFAIIGEELGFVGCLFIIILYILFVWRGALTAMHAPDLYGGLVAVGITSLIGIQAIFNIAVVTSSMPVTGMSLPFISYGGTSLLILLASVGILLNISRQGKKD